MKTNYSLAPLFTILSAIIVIFVFFSGHDSIFKVFGIESPIKVVVVNAGPIRVQPVSGGNGLISDPPSPKKPEASNNSNPVPPVVTGPIRKNNRLVHLGRHIHHAHYAPPAVKREAEAKQVNDALRDAKVYVNDAAP